MQNRVREKAKDFLEEKRAKQKRLAALLSLVVVLVVTLVIMLAVSGLAMSVDDAEDEETLPGITLNVDDSDTYEATP